MDNIDYSNGALNVYSHFFDAEKMLYVEGDDDRAFWEIIINKFDITNIEIQEVGGLQELQKKIEKIKNNEIDAIVAKDLDFSILDDDYQPEENVITTYGHSIENTLICPVVLRKVIRSHGRVALNPEEQQECIDWLESFSNTISPLVIFDAINELTESGVKVLFNDCTSLMRSRISPQLCENKVDLHIASKNLEVNFAGYIENTEDKISEVNRNVQDFIRGHFLFSAAVRFVNQMIKHKGSSKTASNDAFFSSSTLAFEGIFNEHHPHYQHYQSEVNRLQI